MRSFLAWVLTFVMFVGSTNGQTKYCCSIDQWEGDQSMIIGEAPDGVGSLHKVSSDVYYDFPNSRIAGFHKITSSSGNTAEIFVLLVYTNSRGQIYVQDLKTKECTVYLTRRPFPRACVPDNANKTSDFYFGTSVNPLYAEAYHLSQKSVDSSLDVFLTVTDDGQCVPVTQVLAGVVEGVPQMIVTAYTNIRPGISDPSVFLVPPECQRASEVKVMAQRLRRSATDAALPIIMNNLFLP